MSRAWGESESEFSVFSSSAMFALMVMPVSAPVFSTGVKMSS